MNITRMKLQNLKTYDAILTWQDYSRE